MRQVIRELNTTLRVDMLRIGKEFMYIHIFKYDVFMNIHITYYYIYVLGIYIFIY